MFPYKFSYFFPIFALFLFVDQTNRAEAGLVILNFKQIDPKSDNVDTNNEFKICAVKKEILSNDNSVVFDLINLKNEDGCRPIDQPFTNKSAVYLHTPKTNCPFTQMAKNLQANNPSLVLIGSDGPIVIFFNAKYANFSLESFLLSNALVIFNLNFCCFFQRA